VKHVLNGYQGSLRDEPGLTQQRQLPKSPFKVLDAPALQDDFYLNLIDWSNNNLLSVGLGNCVYLWSPSGGKVHKLCENAEGNTIASVGWSRNSQYLGVGTVSGEVQLWDVKKMVKVRTQTGHSARTCSIAWSDSSMYSTGSRDTTILHRDARSKEPFY
jgi:cell division cycle 20-like protein 1 (cofactor of APC complex)